MFEPLTRLADLPPAEPDQGRSERIRVRCRTQLGRRAPGASASRGAGPGRGRGRIWQPLILVLGVGYMTGAIIQALRVYGLL